MKTDSSGDSRHLASKIQFELHTYLSGHSENISVRGIDALPDLALDLGKCLLWLSGLIDGTAGPSGVHWAGQPPRTVRELGEGFRLAGLRLRQNPSARTGTLQADLESLKARITRLDLILSRETEVAA